MKPRFWFCVPVGKIHVGFIPWQCECGSGICPGHEECHWVDVVPLDAIFVYRKGA